MAAAVNKDAHTISWIRSMDGEKVTISFDESWDTFYSVFRSVFKSSAPPSPIRASPPKPVIDLDVEVDEDESPDEEEDEDLDLVQEDDLVADVVADIAVGEPEVDDEELDDDDGDEWWANHAENALRIEAYINSERPSSLTPRQSTLPSMDVTLSSILLPVPVDAPVSSFEPPSRCTIRVSVVRWVSYPSVLPPPRCSGILRRFG